MGGKEEKEGPRKIMVNSDEELIEELKKINETLKTKEQNKITCKEIKNKITCKTGKREQ
ncbi:MAG: hypothetical protein ABFD76_11010 [Smithella sp.]